MTIHLKALALRKTEKNGRLYPMKTQPDSAAEKTGKNRAKIGVKNAGKNAGKKEAENTPQKPKKYTTKRRTAKALVKGKKMGVLKPLGLVRVREALRQRAAGATWGELELIGLPYYEVTAILKQTEAGRIELEAAERSFRESLAKRLETKVVQRAINPKKKYVIGRKGGESVVMTDPKTGELLENEPDNGNLLLAGLKALHPDFKEASGGGGGSGAGIVYNIQIGSITNAPNNGGKMAETIEHLPLSIDNQPLIEQKRRDDNP